jgi:hypothetical protein
MRKKATVEQSVKLKSLHSIYLNVGILSASGSGIAQFESGN